MNIVKSYIKTISYALNGIAYAIRTEKSTRLLLICLVIVAILGFVYDISSFEWIILLIYFGAIGSVELLNTAIENLCDRVTKEHDMAIKHAKDLASGATTFLVISAIISLLIIFIPKISDKF